ncbi:hypothetical protein QCA50_018882 [Cerrena zonata]|uniref:C2 domain-containing protein n=1 Tax=Cerrena zonata TaxID=2478898 RepID=A0AAW0FF46_9APHY
MVPKLTLTVHQVVDVQLEKHFHGQKAPKLYVEIKTSESGLHGKTKGIHDLAAQWEDKVTFIKKQGKILEKVPAFLLDFAL